MNNGAHLMLKDLVDIGGFAVMAHGNKMIMDWIVKIDNLPKILIPKLKMIGA